ncbi:GIY-YIG nuclease family protein [Dyella sp. 2RAB6]|uniref:GIY-YIG nuclease family protein n=1 Tax=Dyella sp. 2RAB6 TaxID=3232992 RepID=UPI003F8E840E
MDRAKRKAMLQAYKLAFPPMGIYAIRHLGSGRMLIDQSANTTGALNRHRTQLRLGLHGNRQLQQDWHEQGEHAFAFEVLQTQEERAEPTFDYTAERIELLDAWRRRIPPGSKDSYR